MQLQQTEEIATAGLERDGRCSQQRGHLEVCAREPRHLDVERGTFVAPGAEIRIEVMRPEREAPALPGAIPSVGVAHESTDVCTIEMDDTTVELVG